MNDEYLWNKSGSPDATVAELEGLLGRFGARDADPAWRPPASAGRATVPTRWMLAAAALVLACSATLWRQGGTTAPWAVHRLAGSPTVGARAIADASAMAVGDWLETDASSRATLAVSTVGRLYVEPGTRLQLVESREGAHHLAIARGRVHAVIWAPPGQFVVDTPAARAVDLGCIYSLETAADGSGSLSVDAGWVALAYEGREVFIPAGARVLTRGGVGPGTPHMTDAPGPFVDALSAFDFGPRAAADRRASLARVVSTARREDAVSLWHLLASPDAAERGVAFDALARLAPPPGGVTRAGIISGSRSMRDAWWDTFELGDASTWREWQRRWR